MNAAPAQHPSTNIPFVVASPAQHTLFTGQDGDTKPADLLTERLNNEGENQAIISINITPSTIQHKHSPCHPLRPHMILFHTKLGENKRDYSPSQ